MDYSSPLHNKVWPQNILREEIISAREMQEKREKKKKLSQKIILLLRSTALDKGEIRTHALSDHGILREKLLRVHLNVAP